MERQETDQSTNADAQATDQSTHADAQATDQPATADTRVSDGETVRPFPDVEVDLDDAAEVHRCPRCERPFRRARQRDLHLGEAHDGLTEDERAAFDDAVDAEEDDLFFFHMKVVVTLGLLYSSTVLLYTAIVGLTG